MHFLPAIGGGLALARPGDPGDVGGDGLARGVPGQGLDDAQGVGDGRGELVQADQGHVHARQGRHQAAVALVGAQGDGAGFGDGEVAAGDAHVGLHVLGAQFAPGHLDQLLDVALLPGAGDLAEQVGHLVAREVDGGHDHVGRAFVPQLDDPLAQVRLRDLQAQGLQVVVEQRLLGGHGLGLDDALDARLLRDAADDLVGLLAGLGHVHGDAHALGVLLELLEEPVHVGHGLVLGPGDVLHQAVHVHAGKGLGAAGAVGHGEVVHGGAQEFVVQGALHLAPVFFEIACVLHGPSPPEAGCAFQAARARRWPARARCPPCARRR